jgi:hypothetical protein
MPGVIRAVVVDDDQGDFKGFRDRRAKEAEEGFLEQCAAVEGRHDDIEFQGRTLPLGMDASIAARAW